MSKKKTDRNHFLPKVYLKKWNLQNTDKSKTYLYCYDYKNDKFEKNSFVKSKDELDLNDKLFQDKIYSQIFEDELSKIENNYNRWLNDIENFYKFSENKTISEAINSEEFKNLFMSFTKSTLNMVYFAFVQWVRYKPEERYILFDIFKDILLDDKTEYSELFSEDALKFNNITGVPVTIFTMDKTDKDIYKYPFKFINPEKLLSFHSTKYQIIIDYSSEGNFITTNNPVTPMFSNSDILPYGMVFSLSTQFALRINTKESITKKDELLPIIYPSKCTDNDVKRMNLTLIANNPNSKIITGNKELALNLCKGINSSVLSEIHSEIIKRCESIKEKITEDTLFLDLSKEGY
ncbi:MAG: DUF4238 domain-containing protein [Cyanobacteriota bacterium]